MKKKVIKKRKPEKLDEISKTYEELFDYKLKVRSGEEKNYSKIKFLKKELARKLTLKHDSLRKVKKVTKKSPEIKKITEKKSVKSKLDKKKNGKKKEKD